MNCGMCGQELNEDDENSYESCFLYNCEVGAVYCNLCDHESCQSASMTCINAHQASDHGGQDD